MKKLSRTWLLMLVLAMCTGLTSCEWIVVNDNPVDPTPTPTPTPTPETVVKATDLLKEAQKEGATVAFWYHYEGGLFYAVFKKVGDVYVYQEGGNCNKASTRGSVVETQLTTELLKLKGDGADLGFNVYSADDAGNKNDPIILCKVYSSTAEVKQKTNSPDNYLAAMAANIQNISMKTIMDDVKDIFNGDNKEYQPDNKNHDLENVLILTADDNTDQLLFKSLPEIEKNAAEQGISPEKAIGATIDNLKQNVAIKYEDGSLKLGKVYLEDEKPSVTFDPNDASKNTYLQELKTTGVGTVTYTLSESLNTCGATIDSKSGEVTFTKPGEVTVIAKFTNNDGFYIYAYYTLTINKAPGSISYSEKDAQIKKTVGDDDFTIELEKVGDGVVTYSSSKETVATVNAEGKVKIVGPGKTTITATIKEDTDCYHYETKTARYKLVVVEPDDNDGLEDYNRNDPTEL
ncbi:MAG: Ig-like domain-containing protein [Prevotella sp.]|nr:Ig-like domain-containing protein [Prevotella sp.]